MAKPIAIFGSCVSRDPVALSDDLEKRLLSYSARSSLACALDNEPFPLSYDEIDPEQVVTSAWQRRMITQDLRRGFLNELHSLPAGAVLILDFIDERFDVLLYRGQTATYSAELRKTLAHKNIEGIDLLPASDALRFSMWQQGLTRLVTISRAMRIEIVLNNCFYATECSDGNAVGNPEITTMCNHNLSSMYNFAYNIGITHLFEPQYRFIAASEHKWGRQPFHFTNDVYRDFISRLTPFL